MIYLSIILLIPKLISFSEAFLMKIDKKGREKKSQLSFARCKKKKNTVIKILEPVSRVKIKIMVCSFHFYVILFLFKLKQFVTHII